MQKGNGLSRVTYRRWKGNARNFLTQPSAPAAFYACAISFGKVVLKVDSGFNVEQEAHGPHRSPEKTVQINKHI